MTVRAERGAKYMSFERVLSVGGFEVADASLEWAPRKVSVPVGDGTSAVEEVEVYAPAAWSDRAVTIAAGKYMRRAVGRVEGSSAPSQQRETHLGKVVLRIVNAIAQAGVRQGYFGAALVPATLPCGEAELPPAAQVFRDELYVVLLRQYAAFNSPVWFNCGLFEAYGAYSDSSNFAWSEAGERVKPIANAYARPQCSACFIQSVDDSIESIYGLIGTEAKLFKHGSGTGTNFSTIRGKDEPLSGGGRSSGLMSFLHAFDAGAGALKSGGVTRRAAKMVCLDLDHPEIGSFVTWKAREEKKARALIAAGYSAEFEGEVYRTVSGQNSNTSVRIGDAFMEALLNDVPATRPVHTTILRTTGAVCEQMSVCDLWKSVCDSAWECGDPGVQFADTIDEWSVVPSFGRIRASNPCGEFLFLDDTACNLASINLAKVFGAYVLKEADAELFEHIVRLLITAQDILVDYSSYPTAKIAENSHKFRPLGLGYADLGGWLMSLGIPYDSDEARALAASVTSLMTATAYSTSRELADVVGQGPWLRADIECAQSDLARVIRMHAAENENARLTYRAKIPGANCLIGDAFFSRADAKWRFLCELRDLLFVRNAQVTVIAPTGTIGLLMDCDATGIEPVFALCAYKKLAGGGSMRIPCRAAAVALESAQFGLTSGAALAAAFDYIEKHGTVVGAPGVPASCYPIFDTASEAGGRCISADGHLKMVAAIQPFVSGGISKTINLPESATPEDIGRIYESAWRAGIKSITVYRDKSKGSQPLQSQQSARSDEAKSATSAEQSAETARPLRRGERERKPRIRDGKSISCEIDGVKVNFRTGEYEDGRLCELFIDGYKSGMERSKQDAFAVAVSLGLQCGVPLAAYVRQFENMHFAPSGFVTDNPFVKTATSPYDMIFRTLAAMYPDGKLLDKRAAPIVVNVAIDGKSVRSYGLSAESQADNARRAPRTCVACGGAMLPSGACYTCTTCGANTGCG